MAEIENIKQAVILAGGKGMRLRPLTDNCPKPMVLVAGIPFLEHLILLLKKNGIKEIVLLLGYLPQKVTDYFGDGSKFNIKISYSISDVEDETGTRIKKAEHLLNNEFLLLYGDNYWPLDLARLHSYHQKKKTRATVTIYTNPDQRTKNNMLVDENGIVVTYDKSRLNPNLNGVEIGFFILSKEIVNSMPSEKNFSFEAEMLPILITEKQLAGYQTEHPYYSISTPEKLKIAGQFLRPRKVALLDRDGVVNKKAPRGEYITRWENFEFLPRSLDALRLLSEKGFEIYIVSNQAGVGRGVMTTEDLANIDSRMKEELGKNGVSVNDTIYCIHGWNDGCDCRKPKPGMFFELARRHLLDLSTCYFIGDDERDWEAGTGAGCKTILVDKDNNLLSLVNSILKK